MRHRRSGSESCGEGNGASCTGAGRAWPPPVPLSHRADAAAPCLRRVRRRRCADMAGFTQCELWEGICHTSVDVQSDTGTGTGGVPESGGEF